MKRLTTDHPDGNFETMLNFVYGEDGWAHIRHDGENENVPLTEWAKKQCEEKGCFLTGSAEEIDETLCDCRMDCPDCPIALAYCFASQAVHMRGRLKRYEDVLFDETGKELLSLDDLRKLAVSNDLLKKVQKYAQAEKNKRLAVLPCKVGDVVYDIQDGTPYATRVLSFSCFGDQWACRTVSSFPDLSEFGKRVFLTLEEAEAALKKREVADNEEDHAQ